MTANQSFDTAQVKKRIERLRKLIAYHRTLYYAFDAPELSDAAFDSLVHELEALEKQFPQYTHAKSPTQTVGAAPLEKFQKVPHQTPMLSFVDAFSPQELQEWVERAENYTHQKFSAQKNKEPLFYCELKIDGLAIELIYEKGILTQALTRGDGYVGEEVTAQVRTIADIPQKLEQLGPWPVPPKVTIRGEVYLTKDMLERMNAQQQKKGKKLYANTRNLAAGSLRQLDPAVTASRKLLSFQYDIASKLPFAIDTHERYHQVLSSWGCKINPHNQVAHALEEVYALRDAWEKKRNTLAYEIDGIVVLLNNNALFARAGVVGRAPRGAIAYKFKALEATTILRKVRVQVGRTGVLTPVAELDPVLVGGVTITNATLHNFDEIKRLDARIGDTVVVTRSGDVIPKITRVLAQLRTGKEKTITVPKQCPVDGSLVVADGVFLKCSNKKCGARNRNQIIHFVSRAAFDIRGLGKKIIDRFLDEGLIGDAGDIFSLTQGDIQNLERFGEKSASNILQEISEAKEITLDKFLYALGIPQVGEETAGTLAKKIQHDVKNISIPQATRVMRSYTRETLQELPDIGPKVAESIYEWTRDPHNEALMHKLIKAGIVLKRKPQKKEGVLTGKTICITGTLDHFSRARAKTLIEEAGGMFHATITKQVNIVVAGNNPGSKLAEAKKWGIEVWNEQTFIKMLGI